jgi:hypothetical protein
MEFKARTGLSERIPDDSHNPQNLGAMIAETRLPHRRPRLQSIRKSSLDELHRPLPRNLRCGRQKGVPVIGHDHEFVEKEFALIPIMRERFDQEAGRCLAPENGLAMSRNRSDEEDAVGVHFEMFVRTGERCLCEMSQFAAWNSKTVHRG